MSIILVKQTPTSLQVHLQWSLDPVTTYCGVVIQDGKIWRAREGRVTCTRCIDINQRVRRGGDRFPALSEELPDLS